MCVSETGKAEERRTESAVLSPAPQRCTNCDDSTSGWVHPCTDATTHNAKRQECRLLTQLLSYLCTGLRPQPSTPAHSHQLSSQCAILTPSAEAPQTEALDSNGRKGVCPDIPVGLPLTALLLLPRRLGSICPGCHMTEGTACRKLVVRKARDSLAVISQLISDKYLMPLQRQSNIFLQSLQMMSPVML